VIHLKAGTGVWVFHDGTLTLLGSVFTLYLGDGGVRISYEGPAPSEVDAWLPAAMEDEVEVWVIGRTKTLLAFGRGLIDGSWDALGTDPRIRGEVRSTGRWYGPALDEHWDHLR